MSKAVRSERDVYADYIKGLLIILVVMGHVIQYLKYHGSAFWDDPIYKSIYMFHMPLFIGISGYYTYFSLQKKTALAFIKERVIILLIPLITWGTINGIFDIIVAENSIPDKGMYIYMTIRRSYWFIWAVLFHSVLVGVLKLIKLDNRYIIMVVGILSMLIPLFFTKNVIMAFTKDMFCFFILGYLLASADIYKLYSICRKYIIVIIILAIACYCVWSEKYLIYFTPADIYHLETGILRLAAGIILSAGFLTIAFIIYKSISKSKTINYIALLGTKTMGIYLIQGFIFSCLTSRLFDLSNLPPFPSVFYLIPTLFIIIVSYSIIKMIEKNWLTAFIFFGKQRKKKNTNKINE